MTPSHADAVVWGGAGARRQPGWLARAALLLFSLSVPVDSLGVSWIDLVVLAAGATMVFAGVLTVARTGTWRPIPAPLMWMMAFTLWAAVTMLWSHELQPSLERVLTYAQLLALLWLAWQIARTRLDVRASMAGFVVGCGIVAVGTWQAFLSGLTYVEMTYGPGAAFDEARYAALGFDPNDLGLTLAIGVPMAGYLGLNGEGHSRRLWLAYLPLALSAIVLSGSRGAAFAAVFAVAAVLWWIRRQDTRGFLLALLLLAAGIAAVRLGTPETWERIFTVRQQLAGGTLGERLPIWRAGWNLFLEHPFLGVGAGGFQAAVTAGLGYPMVAHNTPLSLAAESGLIGLVLFYGAPASIAWSVRRSPRADRDLVLGLLLTWFIGAASLTWEHRKTTWLLLLIGAAVSQLGRDDATTETP